MVLQPKNHQLCSSADARVEVVNASRNVNAFFGLKTVVNKKKSVNLGIISTMHTIYRQSYKEETCPFKQSFKINFFVALFLISVA